MTACLPSTLGTGGRSLRQQFDNDWSPSEEQRGVDRRLPVAGWSCPPQLKVARHYLPSPRQRRSPPQRHARLAVHGLRVIAELAVHAAVTGLSELDFGFIESSSSRFRDRHGDRVPAYRSGAPKRNRALRDRSVILRNRVMLIRTEQPMDVPKIRALNRAVFDATTEADIIDVLRSDAENVLSLVAEEGGEIVGHIMFSPVQLIGAADVRAMALAPMAVSPECQRAGIGSALVRAGLEECQCLGTDAVFVVGHPTYYPRFGFKPASSLGFVCEFEVPDEAFMVAELAAGILDGKTAIVHFHPAFNGGHQ